MSEQASHTVPSPDEGPIATLLGRGSEFSGKLTFEGTVRIDGRFSGEIFSEGTLVVGEGAEISADIAVKKLLVKGVVEGNLTAQESIEIHTPARVRGKLTCPELEIQKGVHFDGSCEMSEMPAKESKKAAREPEKEPTSSESTED
jgi:cytoskeletal protein CcmA (bactofilin family)